MNQENRNMAVNTVTKELATAEDARIYEDKRFGQRYKTRKVDRFEKAFAAKLFDMVGKDAVIVDVPCGNGRFFETFSKAGKLFMIDYSENMLNAAKERFSIGKNVEMLQGDITNLPLDSDIADLCFCMRLFHHMKTDEVRSKALKELARISKKYVAISFYNKKCLRYFYRKILGKKIRGNYVTFEHIAGLAGQSGLAVVDRFPKSNLIEQQSLVIFEKV